MAGTVLVSAASQITKLLYDDGSIYELSSAFRDGLDKIFKGQVGTHVTGMDGIQFALEHAFPGAGGSLAEDDEVIGTATGESLSRASFQRHISKLRSWAGVLELSHKAIHFSPTDRMMVNLFKTNLRKHIEFASMHDYWTMHYGASGFLCQVAATGITGSGLTWTIPINTATGAGSYRWSQKAHALLPGMKIQVIVLSTGAVAASTDTNTPNYEGTIDSISGNGEAITVTWNGTSGEFDNTATDLSDAHVIRLHRRASLLEKYGLVDFVGDANTTYRNESTTTNSFPYSTGETGIDPDSVGEWTANIINTGGSTSISQIDTAWQTLEERNGDYGRSRYAMITTPAWATDLIREQRAFKRYRPDDPNDQGAMPRDLYDGQTKIYRSRAMSKDTMYIVCMDDLSVDTEQNLGVRWARTPDQGGSFSGEIFERADSKLNYRAMSYWYGQRMTLNRKNHVRLQPGASV